MLQFFFTNRTPQWMVLLGILKLFEELLLFRKICSGNNRQNMCRFWGHKHGFIFSEDFTEILLVFLAPISVNRLWGSGDNTKSWAKLPPTSTNPFHASDIFIYSPENIRKPLVLLDNLWGHKKRPVAWNELVEVVGNFFPLKLVYFYTSTKQEMMATSILMDPSTGF